jgi:hypothetical protein
VGEIAIDGGFHQLIRERDRIPMRHRGTRLHRVGRIQQRSADCVSACPQVLYRRTTTYRSGAGLLNRESSTWVLCFA